MKTLWLLIVIACLAWYSTITIYVAIRGAGDIKSMLKSLADSALESSDDSKQP